MIAVDNPYAREIFIVGLLVSRHGGASRLLHIRT